MLGSYTVSFDLIIFDVYDENSMSHSFHSDEMRITKLYCSLREQLLLLFHGNKKLYLMQWQRLEEGTENLPLWR